MDIGQGSLLSLLSRVEVGGVPHFTRAMHGHSSFVRRMKVQSILRGHAGCVNRLAFSDDASLLISGSDDCTLRIWAVDSPKTCSPRGVVSPGHVWNIFGVTFIPGTGNRYVASGGLDKHVRYTHVETGYSVLWNCHSKSVKTVSAIDANSFLSASCDGTMRLFDVRQSPATPPHIIVGSSVGPGRLLPLNSAIPCPTFSHHVLAAANDSTIRIYDIRAPCATSTCSMSIGNCIESYCPPHLHKSSPEQSAANSFRPLSATYANFSQDGKHIVATYFDESVTVFDRPRETSPVVCRTPFLSQWERSYAISSFTTDAARYLCLKAYPAAISSANRALQLDDRNLFALICKAEALLGRERTSDFRSAYCSLQRLMDILLEDSSGQSIAYLWRMSDTFGEHGIMLPPSKPTRDISRVWKEKNEIWIVIFQYLQALSLYRMIPPLYFSMLLSPDCEERVLTKKRLEYIDRLCSRLEKYREEKCSKLLNGDLGDWEAFIRRAFGDETEQKILYPTGKDTFRRRVLKGLVEKFLMGIDRMRERLCGSIACLQSDETTKMALGSGEMTDAAEPGSDNSDMDNDDNDPAAMRYNDDSNSDDDDFIRQDHCNSSNGNNNNSSSSNIGDSELELWGPLKAPDNCRCFTGHVSQQTDIKEANFFGSNNQVVLSGSDDGQIYMWSATTSQLLRRVSADGQIVNCVLGHPHKTMIFASGIDDTIKVLAL